MTTYNYTIGGAGFPARYAGRLATVERYFDMAAIAAARAAAGQAAIGAADVLEAIDVPAQTWVQMCGIQVSKVEGAAATGGIGDGVDPDGYIATTGVNFNALATYTSLLTTPFSVAVGGGKYYAVADTIDALIDSAAMDVAQFLVFAVMVECLKTETKGT